MEKKLHIICFDVPYPVEHGGLFDPFYKLPALHSEGVKITLHCFYKRRKSHNELNKYCEHVFYYKRSTGVQVLSGKLPYIVASRKNEELLKRLLQDNYPILMEGIHCTYPAFHKSFSHRKMLVRLHNVEHIYYKQMFNHSRNLFKKLYYYKEGRLLKKYEKKLAQRVAEIWSVSQQDVKYYQSRFNCRNVNLLPVFLPPWTVNIEEGKGDYCLYHGNLSVAENEHAVWWLLKNVFNELKIPFVVAGKNPSKKLKHLIESNKNTCLIQNPSENEMSDIIAKAHIHILPSFNKTGIKLKLLNALFNGRYCIINSAAADERVKELCCIADHKEEMKEKITSLFHQPFIVSEIEKRKKILLSLFNNQENSKKIVSKIWGNNI